MRRRDRASCASDESEVIWPSETVAPAPTDVLLRLSDDSTGRAAKCAAPSSLMPRFCENSAIEAHQRGDRSGAGVADTAAHLEVRERSIAVSTRGPRR